MIMPKDRYIQVGRIRTRYWAEGSRGSPVVLMHGVGRFIEDWLPSLDALAAQHCVYAVDLPGHGRTDKPTDAAFKVADLKQFVRDLMATLEIEHAHLVGHSLGGAIGTRLAIEHRHVVDRLILVSSAGLGKQVTAILRIATIPILGEMLTRPSRSGSANMAKAAVHDREILTDEWMELDYQMSALPGAQQSLLRVLRANGSVWGQARSMYRPNLDGLSSITKPVLVVWGREDRILPVEHATIAAKGLPDACVRIFDGCGHFPMLEHTQAFNDLLLEFLSDEVAGSPNQ